MLAGKYPSDIAAELEPRLTWDRVDRSARRIAAPSRMTAIIPAALSPTAGCTRSTSPIGHESVSSMKSSCTSRESAMSSNSGRRRGVCRQSSTIASW